MCVVYGFKTKVNMLFDCCCSLQEHLTKLLRTLQSNHQEPLLVFSFSKCVLACWYKLHSFVCLLACCRTVDAVCTCAHMQLRSACWPALC
jgi:hypothetical protein